jgi:hypothetical protein
MAVRADTVIGAMAGVVALVTIAVFGYLTIVTPGGGIGWLGGSPSAAPAPSVKMAEIEEVVDDNYKFRLTAPHPRWRVFDHAAADETWSETNAAMLSDGGVVQLFVSRVGPITLEKAEAAVTGWMGGATPVERRTIRWLGHDAVEMRFDGAPPIRQRIFLRDGFLYRFAVSPFGGPTGVIEADYPGLWGALTLLDGALAPESYVPAPRDTRGLDWRIEAGTWESVSAGLAITPPPGWRIVAGRTLKQVRPDVDVQFLHVACGCFVTVQSRATVGPRAPGARTVVAEIAGASYDLVDFGETSVSRHLAVQIDVEGGPVAIEIWSPAADGDGPNAMILGLLSGITKLDAGKRTSIASDLIATRYHPTALGADWADRNGTFVHYPSGLIFARPPDGMWKVSPPPDATAELADAVLVGSNLRADVWFGIVPDDNVTSSVVVDWLEDVFDIRPKQIDLTGLRADLLDAAEVGWVENRIQQVHRIAVLVGDDGKKFRVHIWGPRATLARFEKELATALAGIAVKPVAVVEDRFGKYVYRRWGFAIDLPGWDKRQRVDNESYFQVEWNHDNREMVGIIAEPTGSPTSAVTLAQARNMSSAAVGRGAGFPPTRGRDTIGGMPATRVSWKEHNMYVAVLVVERHELVYTIFVRGTEATLANAKRVFTFVDPT